MSANSRDYDSRNRSALEAFLATPKEDIYDVLARVEQKLDVLTAMVTPVRSDIIIVGAEVKRIVEQLKRGNSA